MMDVVDGGSGNDKLYGGGGGDNIKWRRTRQYIWKRGTRLIFRAR